MIGRLLLLLALLAAPAATRPPAAPDSGPGAFDPGVSASDPVAAFAAAALAHGGAQRRLAMTRGLPPPPPPPPGIADVAAALAGRGYATGTALLLYHFDGPRLLIWLIDARGLAGFAAVPASEAAVATAGANLRQSLGVEALALTRAPRQRGVPLPDYPGRHEIEGDARRLAALLLPPVLHGPIGRVDHLIVLGNGTIATIPFAMLPLAPGQVLIDAMDITVAPGLHDLTRWLAPWDGAVLRAGALIIGNPQVGPSLRWDVPDLPGAAAEATAVAALLNATPVLGVAATPDIVYERAQTAGLLYFAAHGLADPANPLDGGVLMLAGPTAEAGFLSARTVQDWGLDAGLVVLSACQTGLGRAHDGGVIGLARAFHAAGVPRAAVSLWSVSDAATRLLMTRFAQAALTMPPAAALRQAILATRTENPDPVDWAPFMLFGTPR